MYHTVGLAILLTVIFIIDTFFLVPKDVNKWSKAHIVDGDKTGALTVRLKLVTSKFLKGEIWRPFTSMFLHAGVVHILFNVVTLLNLGWFLEPMLGGTILIFFFLSGVFSAFCMIFFTKIEDGLGASTGIFGLFGMGIAFAISDFSLFLSLITPLNWIILAAMLVFGNLTDTLTRLEHLTGTIGGFLIGIVYFILL